MKTYSELMRYATFEERFEYLLIGGAVGSDTFGFDRFLNQEFYRSSEWRHLRNSIIVRDNGFDLGVPDREIGGKILIHHMNPIDIRDVTSHSDYLMDPENLICVSQATHNAIHYGNSDYLFNTQLIDRSPNDTCPWRV